MKVYMALAVVLILAGTALLGIAGYGFLQVQ